MRRCRPSEVGGPQAIAPCLQDSTIQPQGNACCGKRSQNRGNRLHRTSYNGHNFTQHPLALCVSHAFQDAPHTPSAGVQFLSVVVPPFLSSPATVRVIAHEASHNVFLASSIVFHLVYLFYFIACMYGGKLPNAGLLRVYRPVCVA